MTNLTNLVPAASFGDLITCNNSGNGLTTSLQQIQDGFGNGTPLQLSTTTVNVTAGNFQIGGTVLNVVNGCLQLPTLAADPASGTLANGMIYYNTATNHIRAYVNGAWATVI